MESLGAFPTYQFIYTVKKLTLFLAENIIQMYVIWIEYLYNYYLQCCAVNTLHVGVAFIIFLRLSILVMSILGTEK